MLFWEIVVWFHKKGSYENKTDRKNLSGEHMMFLGFGTADFFQIQKYTQKKKNNTM